MRSLLSFVTSASKASTLDPATKTFSFWPRYSVYMWLENHKGGIVMKQREPFHAVSYAKWKEVYLDELMDMVVHKLIRRNARKCLKVFNSNSRMGPHQGNSSIVLNIGCLGAHFLLPLCQSSLSLWLRSELFRGSCKRGYPRGFRDGDSRGDQGPLLNDLNHFLSQTWKRLFLLGLHPGVYLLIKLGHHLYITKKEIYIYIYIY